MLVQWSVGLHAPVHNLALRALDNIRLITPSAPRTDLAPAYVDQRTASLVAAMKSAGFNAVGPGSDAEMWGRGLPYAESLQLSGQLAAEQQLDVPDVYANGFAELVRDLVQVAVRPRRRDATLIGYFSDDGLAWAPNRHPSAVLATYLLLPWSDGGRAAAVDFLRLRYRSDTAAVRRAWGVQASDFTTLAPPAHPNRAFAADAAAFSAQVLARYLSLVAADLHRDDPVHRFLGANLTFSFAGALGSIWSIADVASVRLRSGQNASAVAAALERVTARPIWLEITGCGAAPAGIAKALANPRLLGYGWSPSSDWQSGACSQAAAHVWAPLNHITARR